MLCQIPMFSLYTVYIGILYFYIFSLHFFQDHKAQREFFVKFLNYSYWHCTWISELQVGGAVVGSTFDLFLFNGRHKILKDFSLAQIDGNVLK